MRSIRLVLFLAICLLFRTAISQTSSIVIGANDQGIGIGIGPDQTASIVPGTVIVGDDQDPTTRSTGARSSTATGTLTAAKLAGAHTTVLIPPGATAFTVAGQTFAVHPTNVPIPGNLLHGSTGSQDYEDPLSGTDGRDNLEKEEKRLNKIVWGMTGAAGGAALIALLFGLCVCCRRRRTRKTTEKTTVNPSGDPTGRLYERTADGTQPGTFRRETEEGRGRGQLSQLIGTGAGQAGQGGRSGEAGSGAAQAGENGSGIGQAGSGAAGQAGSGIGQAGSAVGQAGESAAGAGGAAVASGESGATEAAGATTKTMADGEKVVASPVEAEHVEAVPTHDGTIDSLRTGSQVVDIGSLRGRKVGRF